MLKPMRLSDERKQHIEGYLKLTLRRMAKRYHARVEELRDHFSMPTSDRKKAILTTHAEYFEAMAKTIVDAYRTGFMQEGLLPDGNDIGEIEGRTSYYLHQELADCVKRLPLDLTMSGNTNDIINNLLSELNAGLHVFVTGTKLNSKVATPAATSGAKTDFAFISNVQIRKIVERDYVELKNLDPDKTPKAVLVLAGAIIEALLFDALVENGKWTFQEACQRHFKDMIYPAKQGGIISHDNITEVLRVFRNLIHIGREIKDNLIFDKTHAKHALSSAEVIITEVRGWRQKRTKKPATTSR
jgi:hypothetical protein